jgi:FkbM family methyltransferase
MPRIFLDVGAHFGETAEVALEKRYSFDRICCFEPSKKCLPQLHTLAQKDSRVEVYPFGLGAQDCHRQLRRSGELSATVVGAESQLAIQGSELVEMRDIAKWMDHNLDEDDEALCVMKINCEGSEVELLERLLETKKLSYFYSVVISWDIREYERGLEYEAALRGKILKEGVMNHCSSDDVMIGASHAARVDHWLKLFGIDQSDKNLKLLRKEYSKVFLRYARKTGVLHRFEHRLKTVVRYDMMPAIIKRILRFLKRFARLNRDRGVIK